METELYFPMFVSLKGRKIVVVGAGSVAARRVKTLLLFESEIVIISPVLKEEMQMLLQTYKLEKSDCYENRYVFIADQRQDFNCSNIIWEKRTYRHGDCKDAFLAVAATNCREVNQKIGEDCSKAGVFVTVADRKEESSFYFPAIARKGAIVAGVTASGTDHRLTAKAAEQLRNCLRKMEE